MVNPVLKKIRRAKSDKELAEFLEKHIGSGTNQIHCKDAFIELQKCVPCGNLKREILVFEQAAKTLDEDQSNRCSENDWCAIVKMVIVRLGATNGS